MDEIIRPTVRGMAARGTPFKGVLFAGPDDHRRGPEADRVQRALRRSRDAGADDASEVGSAAGAARHGRRRAQDVRPALARRGGADRGDGREGLSRAATPRARDRRPRRRARRRGRRDVPRRHDARRRQLRRRSAGACSTSRRAAERVAEAQRARLRGGRQDRLAGRLLPPRHRLAGVGPGAPTERKA